MSIKKSIGFTLIELMIGMIIVSFLMSALYLKVRDYKLDQQQSADILEHTKQFKSLLDGSANYFNTNYSEIDDDSFAYVSINQMDEDGFIPPGFGQQYETTRQDLLGLSMRIAYSKSLIEFNGVENQTIRAIITVDQNPSWNSYPENLIINKYFTVTSQQIFNNAISSWYQSVGAESLGQGMVAGIIEKNTFNIKGINSAFNFVLDNSVFPISQRPYDRVVIFWGWPDLNGFPGGVETPGPGPVDPVSEYANCAVSRVQYDAWLNISSQGHDTYDVVESTAETFCGSGTVPFLNLSTEGPPTPIVNIPGWGGVFATVTKTLVSNLGSLGSQCYSIARNWCRASNNNQFCVKGNPNTPETLYASYEAKVGACQLEPVYSYDVSINIGGSVYRSYPLYDFGIYKFGTVNGTPYSVASRPINTQTSAGGNHYLICCPAGTPDLD